MLPLPRCGSSKNSDQVHSEADGGPNQMPRAHQTLFAKYDARQVLTCASCAESAELSGPRKPRFVLRPGGGPSDEFRGIGLP